MHKNILYMTLTSLDNDCMAEVEIYPLKVLAIFDSGDNFCMYVCLSETKFH